jgi:hypothetical protein
VPSRKQRRRREKDFRHDVRVFEVDEEGNEIPIAELRTHDEKPAAKPVAKTQKGGRSLRSAREVSPPSWERAFKRGGLMGGAMLVIFIFLLKNGPAFQRIVIPVIYAVAFIPLTYWIDRTAYRTYLRRKNQPPRAAKPKAAAKKS